MITAEDAYASVEAVEPLTPALRQNQWTVVGGAKSSRRRARGAEFNVEARRAA